MIEKQTDFSGQEVACRTLGTLFEALQQKKLPPETLSEGTGYAVEHLLDKHEHISWAGFRRLMANAAAVWTDDELIEVGQRLPHSPWFRPFALPARLLYSAREFYEWITWPKTGAGNQLFTCVHSFFREIEPNHLVIEVTLQPGYEPSREFFLVTKGTLAVVPAVLGLKPAMVEMEEIEDGARYNIRLPETGGTLAWLRRSITWPFTARAAAQELQEAYAVLHKRYQQLEQEVAERKRAEKRLQENSEHAEQILTRRAQEMTALYKTSLEINVQLDLAQLLRAIVQRAIDLLGAETGTIILLEPDGKTLRVTAGIHRSEEMLGKRLIMGEGIAGRVVQTGEPMIVTDYQHWEGRAPIFANEPIGRILGVPLKCRERIIGVLDVFDEETGTFDEKEVELLNLFAAQAAIAIENARLYENESRQAKQLEMLRQVSQDLIVLQNLEALLQQIVERALEFIGRKSGGIALYRPEQDMLEGAVAVGEMVARLGVMIDRGEGITGKAWEMGQPLIVNDYQSWPGRSLRHSPLSGSIIAVPIQWAGEFLGVLNVIDSTLRPFTTEDAQLLSQFATHAAIAIHNSHLYEQAQQEIIERKRTAEQLQQREAATRHFQEQLKMLHQVSIELSKSKTFDELFRRAVELGRSRLGFDRLGIWLNDDDPRYKRGMFGIDEQGHLRDERHIRTPIVSPEAAVIKRLPSQNQQEAQLPLFLEDVPLYNHKGEVVGRGWAAIAALWDGDSVIGTISTDNLLQQKPVTEFQLDLLALFGSTLGNLGVRKRAEEEIQRRNRELTLLNQVIAASASDQEPAEALLEIVCRELALAFDVSRTVAAMLDEKKTAAIIVAEYRTENRPAMLNDTYPVKDNPIFQHLLHRKSPLVVGNVQSDSRFSSLRPIMSQREIAALLAVPLIIGDEVIGSLGLEADEPRRFAAEEINLVWSIADQVAGALARTRLDRERRQLEAQYHQAQKMEAIGQLTAGIAHDFNNLLTVINGSTELILSEMESDSPHEESLNKVLKAGQRAADLVRQLLAFSRRQVMEPQVLNLNHVVSQMKQMLQRVIGEDIQLETVLAPDLWWTKIDPSQMEQVIVNLAVNARDAMPEGGRLIIETANVMLNETHAARRLDLGPGEHVLLAVSDTGIGMEEQIKAHIFEPFFTTKEVDKGTGLGLATVFGIVKQNRGSIWVYSEPGIGATFKIYLPRAQMEEREKAFSWTKVEVEPPPGQETILLVEDDTGVRELARRVLQGQGYSLLEAKNSQEALDLVARHDDPIDLLLTDVIMPGLNGKALADQLVEMRPHIRVLFMSGYTDKAIVHHGLLNPGVHLLQKPFTPSDLTRKVRYVLDETQTEG